MVSLKIYCCRSDGTSRATFDNFEDAMLFFEALEQAIKDGKIEIPSQLIEEGKKLKKESKKVKKELKELFC